MPPLAAQFNNPERLLVLQQAMARLGQRQLQTNNLAQARADFETAVKQAPADAFLHENYANFLEATGDLPRALAEYLKIVELLPHDFYGCLQAGRLCSQMGRLAEAKPLLKRACQTRPTLPEPWFELGVTLANETNYSEALDCFKHAAQVRPAEGSYVTYQARMLVKLNRHPEAIRAYRDAIKINGTDWNTHFELAGELAAANAAVAAGQEYEEVIRLNPRYSVAHVNLGVVLVHQNRLDEAIQQFEYALELEPSNAAARDYLTRVSAQRNRRW
jgi:tetratricopeptide (TPR) repeat protein